jgi:hypothetical protein
MKAAHILNISSQYKMPAQRANPKLQATPSNEKLARSGDNFAKQNVGQLETPHIKGFAGGKIDELQAVKHDLEKLHQKKPLPSIEKAISNITQKIAELTNKLSHL